MRCISFNRNPSLGPVTFEYGFTKQQLLVTILESCEDFWAREITRGKILVYRSIKLLEGVGKAFVVAARIVGKRPDILGEQGGIPNQELVRFISVAKPEIVRVL